MVLTLRVAVAGVVPEMVTDVGIEQVGASDAPAGELVSEQERLTPPVNPFSGVAVIVTVFPEVAPGLTLMMPLLLERDSPSGALASANVKVVEAVILPVAASEAAMEIV